MKSEEFGIVEGQSIRAVTIENANGLTARIITYGARLVELHIPDRHGEFADIVLGFDNLESYVSTNTYFGAICGRYGNRIAGGRFLIDNEICCVDRNEGDNHLHGGKSGFDRKIWDIIQTANHAQIVLAAISEDGEMGFPGRCNLKTTYELTDDDRLIITMEADTDKVTPMNMVHHSYFNLAGQGTGDVLDQELRIAGRFYTPVNETLLPTGEIRAVENTPFDFRQLKKIGADIRTQKSRESNPVMAGSGYDHNWCLDGAGNPLRQCAEAFDPSSGRQMRLTTTEPGVQFYTGGYLDDTIKGKQGSNLCKYAGFTLETQKFPDAPNIAHFPGSLLHRGEIYCHQMIFHFSTDEQK
jgi:aldose 1-epimerase